MTQPKGQCQALEILEKPEEYHDKMRQYELYNSLFDGRNSFSRTDTDATFMHMKEYHMRNGQLKSDYNIRELLHCYDSFCIFIGI